MAISAVVKITNELSSSTSDTPRSSRAGLPHILAAPCLANRMLPAAATLMVRVRPTAPPAPWIITDAGGGILITPSGVNIGLGTFAPKVACTGSV